MKKVLIIEDDPNFRQLTAEILQLHGWQVFEAEDGEAGLEQLRRHRPEVVLCDLLMPRCNGFNVCRSIRADAELRHTKVVIASGRDYEADRQAAHEAGADEYLTKPVKPEELIATLDRLGTATNIIPLHELGVTSALPPARFQFWGVRGSIATPGQATVRYGGNTSCIEVRAGNEIIILDAGTGLRALGRELVEEFGDRPLNLTLLLTHTHWDHIQGLPFFPPLYRPNCRLRIFGYEGARKGLQQVLTGQMESPYFPVPFNELPGNIEIEEMRDMHVDIGPVKVQAHFANHPGICVGFRLDTPDGSLAFFPDNEPRCRYRGDTAVSATSVKATLEFARAEEQKFIEFIRGVDALIIDAQFDTDEYSQRIGWGHGCVDDAVALALKARAKQLFLFHHDPDHDDAKVEQMVAHARKLVAAQRTLLTVEAAREGAVVELAKISQKKTSM